MELPHNLHSSTDLGADMVVASALQAIGLTLDIFGFGFLVWEVGFSHRFEILSNPEMPIAAPDIDGLEKEADSYRDGKQKKLEEIMEQKHPAWKIRLYETIIRSQIARKYARIEREKSSYVKRQELAALPRADANLKRRIALFKGASLVFLGFSIQLAGTIIGILNLSS